MEFTAKLRRYEDLKSITNNLGKENNVNREVRNLISNYTQLIRRIHEIYGIQNFFTIFNTDRILSNIIPAHTTILFL
jgi:hypothetical protein